MSDFTDTERRKQHFGTVRQLPPLIRTWWSSPIDPRWMIDYLIGQSLDRIVKMLIGLSTIALCVVPLVGLASPSGPQSFASKVILIVIAVIGLAWALMWFTRPWPSQAVSVAFIVFADVSITVACIQDANRLGGFAGLCTFAIIAVYLVFFHGSRLLALHSVWTAASLLLLAAGFAFGPDGDPAQAIVKTGAALMALVVTPPFIQFGFWLLRSDANDSFIDPLTGLLNRRGFEAKAADIIASQGHPHHSLVVMAIDLDHFKRVNDQLGHSTGDEVLVRCARRIESTVRASAALARLGGEEFVVVDVMPVSYAYEVAERIKEAIGAPADRARITASIGVTTAPTTQARAFGGFAREYLESLLGAADRALYTAKRTGRDRVVFATPIEEESGSARN